MIAEALSHPNLMLLPPHAENVAKVIEAISTPLHQRFKRRVCNPFVEDEAKEKRRRQ
jgi:hypothetical protein